MFVGLPAAAQTGTTAIYGQVNDPAGAAIVGAQVTIENIGTKAARNATTDSTGSYRFSSLSPGGYTLRVEMKGFRAARIENLELTVNTTAKQDVALVVGAQNEVIEVTGTAEVLNTTDASLGHPFTEERIKDLPLEARNVVGLLSLQTGAVFVPKATTALPSSNDPRSGSISGSHSDQSNVTLDGVDANDSQFGYAYTSVLRMTPDSVQEFRVTTTNYGAEQGRSSAAQVTLVTKSGTNSFHGSAYWSNRNTAFSSNDWIRKLQQAQGGLKNKPPKLDKNIGGASLGGPLKKDRLFFFANWEYRRDTSETPVTRYVPSDSYRDGTMIYKCANAALCPGGTVQGYKTGHFVPAGYNGLTPVQLKSIDPLGIGPNQALQQYMNQFPTPNTVLSDGFYSGGQLVGNTVGYQFASPIRTSLYTYIARLDYRVDNSGKHTLFARGNLQDDHYASSQQFPGQKPRSLSLDNSRGMAAGYTAVLSPTMVNNFRYGFTRLGNATAGQMHDAVIYFRNIDNFEPMTYSSGRHLPTHNFVDDVTWTKGKHTLQFGANMLLTRVGKYNDSYSYNDGYVNSGWAPNSGKTYMPGASCPAPVTAACLALPAVNSSYTNTWAVNWIAILGIVSEADGYYNYDKAGKQLPTGTAIGRLYAANDYEFYAQDNWRIRPDLTVNAGLRWSVAPAPHEVNGNQVNTTVNLGNWFEQRRQMALKGVPGNTMPDLQFALSGPANGKAGYYETQWTNFSPRLSFAWNPKFSSGPLGLLSGNGKMVVRGGYSIGYDHAGVALANRFDDLGAFGFSTEVSSPPGLNYETMSNIRFAGINTMPPHMPAAPAGGFPQTPPHLWAIGSAAIDSNLTTPYSHLYNFTIGRELNRDYSLEVAYVGRQGRDLLTRRDVAMYLNLVDPKSGVDYFTAARQAIAAGANITSSSASNFTSIGPIAYFENLWPGAASTVSGVKLTATQAIARIFWQNTGDWTYPLQKLDHDCNPSCSIYGAYAMWQPQYSSLPMESSIGKSEYHSMQVSLRKRMSQGLQFDFNYTLSKSSDLASQNERGSMYNPWKNGGYTGFLLNSWDPSQAWGPSDFDTRHNFNINWVWQLPFGHNRRFGSTAAGWVNQIIGDWQISGIYRWNSGFPFSVQDCGSCYPTNWELQGNAMLKDPNNKPPTGTTYNAVGGYASPFKDPAGALSYFRLALPGESGLRNPFRGDRYMNIDTGISKAWKMPFGESHKLKLRWDVFNLTNTPSFEVNGLSVIPDSVNSFGRYNGIISGCDGMATRCMQGSVRYEF